MESGKSEWKGDKIEVKRRNWRGMGGTGGKGEELGDKLYLPF